MKQITKNYISLTSTQAVSKIIGLVWVILVARYLGDIGFGKLSFAMSFCAIFGVVIEFGLSSLTTREVARNRHDAAVYLNNVVTIKAILSVLVSILIFLSMAVLDYPQDKTVAVSVVAFSVIIRYFAYIPRSLFFAFERMEYPSVIFAAGRLMIVFNCFIVRI